MPKPSKDHYKTMPPVKRPYAFDTLRTYRKAILQRMALEWYSITTAGMTVPQIADAIVAAQEAGK